MISKRWLSDDTKVAILLQEEAEAYRQLGDIKREEMSWLEAFHAWVWGYHRVWVCERDVLDKHGDFAVEDGEALS